MGNNKIKDKKSKDDILYYSMKLGLLEHILEKK